LAQWAIQVRKSWRSLESLTQLDADFDQAAVQVLAPSHATSNQRAAALRALLQQKGDLNKIAVDQIRWFATGKGRLQKATKADSSGQELQRQIAVRAIRSADPARQLELAAVIDLRLFFAKPPTESKTGPEAVKQVRGDLKKLCVKFPQLENLRGELEARVTKVPVPKGKKPSGLYPAAEMFKLFPCAETRDVFLLATRSLAEGKDKAATDDPIAAARVDDEPQFDYFTNLLLGPGKDHAAWFEFDLAAFVEAMKAPRRYFEDTLSRDKKRKDIEAKLNAMDRRGAEGGSETEDGDHLPGFEGDHRIELLRRLVTGPLARAKEDGAAGYTIRRRTLRGWDKLRDRWRKAAAAGDATAEKLLAIAADEQSDHRDDFGSAELFQALVQPANQPIWLDEKTQDWHADDPLDAWLRYGDLRFELEKVKRPIRFTPAHPEHSPRFYIFPKSNEAIEKPRKKAPKPGLPSRHEPGHMSLTAGVILENKPTVVRVYYSAPRLRRDRLRSSVENLYREPWLQPMMEALGVAPASVNFANCRVTLLAQDGIHLAFPVEVTPLPDNGWRLQCNVRPDGKQKRLYSLRWPHEKQPANAPEPWHASAGPFSVVAVDLGQRDAGAFARLTISAGPLGPHDVFVGSTPGRGWHASLARTGLIRLPGEDARLWRDRTAGDRDQSPGVALREEPWGERGRKPRPFETDEAVALLERLGSSEMTEEAKAQSFPEQNDKLLVALRRFQGRVGRLQRWHWFLGQTDGGHQGKAWAEVAACDDIRIIGPEQRAQAEKHDPRLRDWLYQEVGVRLATAQKCLAAIAGRALPSRRTRWKWRPHPDSTDRQPLFQLARVRRAASPADPPIWLRGQRGLSLERIEQVRELRQRAQSLNAASRRYATGEPVTRRDDTVPDPCPDMLERMDRLRRERARQTAHAILAEALGLRLRRPLTAQSQERRERDLHGTNEKFDEPAQMIIIEDLSRYRSSQGRAPRENSRLMQWCHRELRDKLVELSEVFGVPVIEAPAAYSSRFCSRTGVAGFRAVEVTAGFTRSPRWAWRANKKNKDGSLGAEAQRLLALDRRLTAAQGSLDARKAGKKRTLLIPMSGGPIFVPVNAQPGPDGKPVPPLQQADINAAINLGLRAVADPRDWRIAPRLRTTRKAKKLLANEKRKFGAAQPLIELTGASTGEDSRPNLFADFAGLRSTRLCHASLNVGEQGTPPLLTGKSLWGYVQEQAWPAVDRINTARLRQWEIEGEKRLGAAF
ncbi:MAG: type V CRISPR-associated protein Cas12b, partial [Terriglobales bacterium]